MDTIILMNKDVETLLAWRDQNINYVRQNAAPFKGIMLEFPETNINIKAYNDAGNISFYIRIHGSSAGKISGQQLPGGFFKAKKNTTKLKSDDVQSIITVYTSLMAYICYCKPEKAARQQRQTPGDQKAAAKKKKSGITYLLNSSGRGPALRPRGTHASPAGSFSVRGHYRKYKSGAVVWIAPYIKGKGTPNSKRYKLK